MNQSFALLRPQLDALVKSNAALVGACDRVCAALAAARDAGTDLSPAQLQGLIDDMAGQAEAADMAAARAEATLTPPTSVSAG